VTPTTKRYKAANRIRRDFEPGFVVHGPDAQQGSRLEHAAEDVDIPNAAKSKQSAYGATEHHHD